MAAPHVAANQLLAERPRRGIIPRSREVLEPGLRVFKLGHRFVRGTRQSDLAVLSTPWWFTEGTIEAIVQAANRAGERLEEVFRRAGAIAKRWGGSADLVVRATIAQPLIAYIGPGTIQDFRDAAGEDSNNVWDMPLWVPRRESLRCMWR